MAWLRYAVLPGSKYWMKVTKVEMQDLSVQFCRPYNIWHGYDFAWQAVATTLCRYYAYVQASWLTIFMRACLGCCTSRSQASNELLIRAELLIGGHKICLAAVLLSVASIGPEMQRFLREGLGVVSKMMMFTIR
jgi:hypothetical protein